MKDLQADEIIALHRARAGREGFDSRVISEANLLQLVFLANRIEEVVPRAAFTFFTLVAYPVFREGNETTAMELSLAVLDGEQYGIDPADTGDLAILAAKITAFAAEPEDAGAWFAAHARRRS